MLHVIVKYARSIVGFNRTIRRYCCDCLKTSGILKPGVVLIRVTMLYMLGALINYELGEGYYCHRLVGSSWLVRYRKRGMVRFDEF